MATVSNRLRYEVLRRDSYACRYCGATAPGTKLAVDAITPDALGGSHKDPANLVTACEQCNNGKGSSSPDTPLVADVAQDAIRWSQAMQVAAAEMLARASEHVDAREQFDKAWRRYGTGSRRKPLPRDADWPRTVDQLLSAGLPLSELEACIDVAMSRRNVTEENVFRYMCGVAWNKVTELQKRAADIVSGIDNEPPQDGDSTAFSDGRLAAADEILAELTQGDRDQYLEWADDGGWGYAHGEPQTDADLRVTAACLALNDVYTDLRALESQVVSVIGGLPGDVGRLVLHRARAECYDHCAEEFSRFIFAAETLRQLQLALADPAAPALQAAD